VTPFEVLDEVYRRFKAEWDADDAAVLLEGDGKPEPGPGSPWVRVSFRDYGGGQHTLGPEGARIYQRTGAAFVQVFTPSVQGPGLGATLAHRARAIFEGRRLGPELTFLDGRVSEAPLSSGDRSYQTNVEVRCTYDETK